MPLRSAFSSLLTILAVGLMLLSSAQGQPYTVAPGTEAVEVSGFGRLPKEITWKADGAEMVLVPGGTYRIGLNDPQLLGFPAIEGPQVQVTIGPFYIDKYETPTAKFNEVADRIKMSRPRLVGEPGPNVAVTGVPWGDAIDYAKAVGKDLPTEAEWEVAARGPLGYLYPWGNSPDPSLQQNKGRAGDIGSNPVDVSPFGVYDMGGNAAEWVKDYYTRSYYSEVSGKENPVISETSEARSVRGGDFYGRVGGRATYRRAGIPIYTAEEIGFRTIFRILPTPEATPVPTPSPTPVRTPTPEERVSEILGELLPYFKNPSTPLPAELAGPPEQTSVFNIANFTPHNITVAFIDPATMKVHRFPTAIGRSRVARVAAPAQRPLILLAYAPQGSLGAVQQLGMVNTASNALLVLEPHMFSKVTRSNDVVLEPSAQFGARQVYEPDYYPFWNQFEVYNATTLPAEVVAGPDEDRSIRIILQPGEAYRFERFGTNAKIKVSANYVGADEAAPDPAVSFTNDERADYRVVFLSENRSSADTVRVITRRVQPMKAELLSAQISQDLRGKYIIKKR